MIDKENIEDVKFKMYTVSDEYYQSVIVPMWKKLRELNKLTEVEDAEVEKDDE